MSAVDMGRVLSALARRGDPRAKAALIRRLERQAPAPRAEVTVIVTEVRFYGAPPPPPPARVTGRQVCAGPRTYTVLPDGTVNMIS